MAKTKMLCPFSKELCQECPMYRGRHYYLCFATQYRGYLGDGEYDKQNLAKQKKFPIPPPLKPSPTWLVFSDFPERKNK